MHIILKFRISFMVVKRETWLNNTKRYRAHIYIYIYIYIYVYVGFLSLSPYMILYDLEPKDLLYGYLGF